MARLSKETWERLKADYVTGAYTLELLAKKYGVSKAAISKKIKNEKWEKIDIKETAELVEMEKVNKSKQKKVNKLSKLTKVSPDKFEEAISEITDLKVYFQNLTSLSVSF